MLVISDLPHESRYLGQWHVRLGSQLLRSIHDVLEAESECTRTVRQREERGCNPAACPDQSQFPAAIGSRSARPFVAMIRA